MTTTPLSSKSRYWVLWVSALGIYLGIGLLKFGNPIILDNQIPTPTDWAGYWNEPWPARWGQHALRVLAVLGAGLVVSEGIRGRFSWKDWRFGLPLAWLLWQAVCTWKSVEPTLSHPTLSHLSGLILCWWIGCFCLPRIHWPRWLMIGILLALTLCLVRAVNQRWGGFRHDRETLLEGEKSGWTNFAAADLEEMKRNSMIISTNGALRANPLILLKLERARVHGTLVYPNALAGAILLLLPMALLLSFQETWVLRMPIPWLIRGLTGFLGLGCLYWTGSKSAWLIALGQGTWVLGQCPWPRRLKRNVITVLVVIGLLAFGLRFQAYFAAGATSVSARFDYWKAALETSWIHPFFGTGPGTFAKPYRQLKSPEAESTRLVHNDYLEQFSDSGFIGGILYLTWIGFALKVSSRWNYRQVDLNRTALWLGTVAWFAQGFVEFGLYIPGLAYPAFIFLGALTDGSTSLDLTKSVETSRKSTPLR